MFSNRLIPVVTIDDPACAIPLAGALRDGGLPVAEITLRTPGGLEAIRLIDEANIPGFTLGAGTVLTAAQVHRAADYGASFAVSPGLDREVVEACRARDIVCLPGAVTATEIQAALALGLDTLKFFPAHTSGGPEAIRALSAPFPGLKFVPTGGINADNLGSYLAIPQVVAAGGSWMVPPQLVRQQAWDEIRDLTAIAVTAAEEAL